MVFDFMFYGLFFSVYVSVCEHTCTYVCVSFLWCFGSTVFCLSVCFLKRKSVEFGGGGRWGGSGRSLGQGNPDQNTLYENLFSKDRYPAVC